MKIVELATHPILSGIRTLAKNMVNTQNDLPHLLIPPEYNIPDDPLDPLRYLFIEHSSQPHVLFQFNDPNIQLTFSNGYIVPKSGFEHDNPIEVLQTSPVVMANGFSFDMHELGSNPYMPSPIPPLCFEIQTASENPLCSLEFLKTRIRSPTLPNVLNELETKSSKITVKKENKEAILSLMHSSMDQICDIVLEVRPFHFIPTVFKVKTNFIIFSAVSNLFHSRLLKVYHRSMASENNMAKQAISHPMKSLCPEAALSSAAKHLIGIHTMETVIAGVQQLIAFFDEVVAGIGRKNAPADDILPAICAGIASCKELSSYIVSTFTYLSEIWPSEGLDEKTTYMIYTCSIAASHLCEDPQPKDNKK